MVRCFPYWKQPCSLLPLLYQAWQMGRDGFRSLPKVNFTTLYVIGTMLRMLFQFQTTLSDWNTGMHPNLLWSECPLPPQSGQPPHSSAHTAHQAASTSVWCYLSDASTQPRSWKGKPWASLGDDHCDSSIHAFTGRKVPNEQRGEGRWCWSYPLTKGGTIECM